MNVNQTLKEVANILISSDNDYTKYDKIYKLIKNPVYDTVDKNIIIKSIMDNVNIYCNENAPKLYLYTPDTDIFKDAVQMMMDKINKKPNRKYIFRFNDKKIKWKELIRYGDKLLNSPNIIYIVMLFNDSLRPNERSKIFMQHPNALKLIWLREHVIIPDIYENDMMSQHAETIRDNFYKCYRGIIYLNQRNPSNIIDMCKKKIVYYSSDD